MTYGDHSSVDPVVTGKTALSGQGEVEHIYPTPNPSPKRQGGENMQNSVAKTAVFRLRISPPFGVVLPCNIYQAQIE